MKNLILIIIRFSLRKLHLIQTKTVIINKSLCIPESFNTNISHQLFNYKITFMNSRNKNPNSKDAFVLKNRF